MAESGFLFNIFITMLVESGLVSIKNRPVRDRNEAETLSYTYRMYHM